ncbi:hypothetical protein FS320_44495 [Microvirga tunisiensis]|uniref:Uncharacterized protein n=1 Tax=Microvirga tunisiensis TaxID=2108360 RepID=A0A5N7N1X0_9HYPH|nr:hypothetical protein [Microvirga tunisiensis]MPR31694.1 hypothetical protein [Microvirga tunisiensis]
MVDRILSDPSARKQAYAIQGMADHLGDLGGGNRTRLIEPMIEQFEQYDPGQNQNFWPAAIALARAREHLNDNQVARLQDAMNKHPILAAEYNDAQRWVSFYNPLSPSEPAAVTQSSRFNNSIGAIEGSVGELVRDNPVGEHRDLIEVRAVSVSINSAYDHARRELRDASRTRDRSTLAR